jgi:redox-sensitive bicupin YhaK (pirin superfamily)
MEILTFMVRGSLEHRDSLGNGSVIRTGDVQRMTAGTGVRHSEFNPSDGEETRLLQVWIEPETTGLAPSYEQRSFGDGWQLVASRDGRDGSLVVHQDVDVYRARLAAGEGRSFALRPGRHAWVQVVDGEIEVHGHRLESGDGAAVSGEAKLEIAPLSGSDFLLFDLA